jgi:hypothetical protein
MLRSQGYGTCAVIWFESWQAAFQRAVMARQNHVVARCIPPEALDKWRHPPFLDAFPSILPCLLTQVPYPEHDHRRELNKEFRSETRSR